MSGQRSRNSGAASQWMLTGPRPARPARASRSMPVSSAPNRPPSRAKRRSVAKCRPRQAALGPKAGADDESPGRSQRSERQIRNDPHPARRRDGLAVRREQAPAEQRPPGQPVGDAQGLHRREECHCREALDEQEVDRLGVGCCSGHARRGCTIMSCNARILSFSVTTNHASAINVAATVQARMRCRARFSLPVRSPARERPWTVIPAYP